MERQLPGLGALVREQHQHARGRHAPHGLPLGAHAHGQRLRARDRPDQGEGRAARAGRCARGPRRDHLGQAPGSAVRGPDEDEARQLADAQPRRDDHQRRARRVVRGAPGGGARDHQQGAPGRARPPGRAQGARPRAPQDGARELAPARQAQGLLQQRPGAVRAVPGRGQQRRRHRRRRARPRVPGDPAAARQDPQRREGADQQDPLERRDPGHDHDDQHRHRRGVQPRRPALPQDRGDDGRRRRRRAHPHADPDVLLPAHAADDRGGPRLHRAAAALPAQVRPPRGALPPERHRARAHPAARAAGRHRGGRPLRRVAALHRGALPALPLGAARVRGLGRAPARGVRRAGGRLRQGPPPDRGAGRDARRARELLPHRRARTTSPIPSRSSRATTTPTTPRCCSR